MTDPHQAPLTQKAFRSGRHEAAGSNPVRSAPFLPEAPRLTSEENALRAASVLLAFTGLAFGLPALWGMKSLAAGEGVPLVFGFPAYGGGGFARAGIDSTVPLVGAFLAVCVAEIVAAWLVWHGQVMGGWLALLLMVPGAVFWWGFDLPFPWVLGAARTLLLWYGWGALR